MEPGHLNVFVPYENKRLDHEDQLTRAFLILLRYAKPVEHLFIELLRERMEESGIEMLPPSLHSGISGVESAETQVWSTTKARLEGESGRLVSVVITDELLKPEHQVSRTDRLGVYDGFVRLQPNWIIVIENKPDHRRIWEDQLSSAFNDDFEIEPTPVVLRWSEVISRLGLLITNGLVVDAAKAIVEDFLTFAAINFPELSPYDSFRLCGDQYHLLEKHCVSIMSEASLGAVEYHRGWYHSIRIENKPGVKEVVLHPDPDSEDSWPIQLDIHPADTMSQARSLYRSVDVTALTALVDKGWVVRPNFHVAFMSPNLYWCHTEMALKGYLEYWVQEVEGGRLAQLPRSQWRQYFAGLRDLGIISAHDIDGINETVMHTEMSTLNICPGISFRFTWKGDTAVRLEDSGTFVSEFKQRVNEVLSTW